MADGFIRVPPDDTGKRIDTEQLTVAATTVQRERQQITGAADVEIARVLNTDPAAADYALTTRELGPVSPQTSTGSVTVVSAGSTGSVDSTQIGSGLTGKLLGFVAAGSVPFKIELFTVLNGVTTLRLVKFGRGADVCWRSPHKEFITQAEDVTAGFDGFRLVFTNLDTGSGSADFYGTFFWDEV